MECQTHETALMRAAWGSAAKWVMAKLVASPAFCIPTSMVMVRFLALFIPVARPTP